jgi:D-beta-D-heptose 7-phosphate kinase/D-beta-D-heptose 1-phosphate adenosyltransferase
MDHVQITKEFAKARVLVLGDVMLDQYWWGTVDRISPEAPVPVVRLDRTTIAAGGAANVAMNVAGLGAKPILMGGVGDDVEARLLIGHLNERGISSEYLKTLARPTSVKTRIVAHGQHVVRIDKEKLMPLAAKEEDAVVRSALDVVDLVDAVIVSDYAKGFVTNGILNAVIAQSRKSGIPVLIDPKGKDYGKYSGATILTPNRREALEACGLDANESDQVPAAAARIYERCDLSALVVTEGENGITLVEPEGDIFRLRAQTHEVYDVTGAGDTVIAGLGVSIASGLNFREAVYIANVAAGVVVEQVGTTAITVDHLKAKLEELSDR